MKYVVIILEVIKEIAGIVRYFFVQKDKEDLKDELRNRSDDATVDALRERGL